ncbi:MAG: hypothetical protein U9R08_06170 [Nanoarchaeota archaeon]|nr:hypothetical protein [Nanoarchaeota archaeon]
MKKRITLLGIIVAVLSFLNIGSVSAYNPSQFDLVPEPVYNLLRKILVEFGVGPSESFIVFAKFVLFIVLFALFYYGSFKFFKQPRICTVISLGLSLFSVILLPGTYVLKMAELYAGIVGIMLPVLLIWLGFKMYKNFSHPVMKGIIDALSIMIVSSTMAAVQGGSDLPFLFETIKWFGLLQLFFMFMLVIHILEAFSWAAGQMGEGGSGGGSSLWDKVFGGGGDKTPSSPGAKAATVAESKLEKKEEAELESAQKLLALEKKLDERVLVDIRALEAEEYLQYKHLAQLLKIVAVLKQGARDLKYSKDGTYIKKGFLMFNDSFNAFNKILKDLIGNFEHGSKEFKSIITVLGKEFNIDKHLISEINRAETMLKTYDAHLNKYNTLSRADKKLVDDKSQADIHLLHTANEELRELLLQIKNSRVILMTDYESNVKIVSERLKPVQIAVEQLWTLLANTYKTYSVMGLRAFGKMGVWDKAMHHLTMIEGHLKTAAETLKKNYESLDKSRAEIQKEFAIFVDLRKKVIEAFKLLPTEIKKKIR